MGNKSKRDKIIRIRKIIITIMIVILSGILISSYISYRNEYKKIEVKNAVREYLIAVEASKISANIEFDEKETIADIKVNGGEKLATIKKYINIDNLNNIEALTIEDANKIVNNDDFDINIKGQFLKIK
ncbi:hypothetical protein H9660_12695 [Clostridium sp. Sa3CUN1]|uniref:Uncharacterized protein n=1 Tax=Clostridium gallinarum TaxID=2762246 RepID=A0ABR8Q6J7_9CLOT|nr:hypothetical protein [Clostridium gallinarum]MBD7916005.1 hypothetical protein [Clostridium gallinarum]